MSATLMPADKAVQPRISGFDIAVSNHVPIRQTIRDSFIMAGRGLLKVKYTPEQLFDVTFQPIVFTLMFAYLFGGAIAGDTTAYLPFLIPGILVQTVITTSVVTGVQLREDMEKGVFDRFKSMPIARIAPLAGALLADTVRYLIASVLTLAVGMLIGYRPGGGFVGLLATGLLVIVAAWSVSWIFALLGVVARSASAVQGVSTMLLFMLTFVSNVFVKPETMPSWMAAFVNINPISHLVTAARDLANNGVWGLDVFWTLLGSAVIVAIFAPLTVRAYMRRV